MNDAALYLFDDATARTWQPFALTRPVGELLFGAHRFRERAERLFGSACAGHIAAAHLRTFREPGAAPVRTLDDIPRDRARVFLSSRAVLEWARPGQPTGAGVILVGGQPAGWYAPTGSAGPDAAFLRDPAAADAAVALSLAGRLLPDVWDLMAGNGAQIARDFEGRQQLDGGGAHHDTAPGQTIGHRPGALRLGTGVTIEPNVVFDFTAGPIWLDDDVTIRAFTRLAGPAYVGRGATLLGGPYAAVSIGPVCKVHGEMEESVVLGYSNKAHDGFLGHAYIGMWVNLGALTTNSDLKNNYGTIRVWTPTGEADTGLMKLGCLLGDHVKTGIGTMLNTGTLVGAGANLYGTAMPPKYVPPFSWGTGAELVEYRLDRFLEVASAVLRRRDLELDEDGRTLLAEAWRIGRSQA